MSRDWSRWVLLRGGQRRAVAPPVDEHPPGAGGCETVAQAADVAIDGPRLICSRRQMQRPSAARVGPVA